MRRPKIGDRFYNDEYDLNGTVKAVSKDGWIRILYDDWTHGDFPINGFYKHHNLHLCQ